MHHGVFCVGGSAFATDGPIGQLAHRRDPPLAKWRFCVPQRRDGAAPIGEPRSEPLGIIVLSIPHEYEILLGVAHDGKAYYQRAGLHGFQFQAAAFARAR